MTQRVLQESWQFIRFPYCIGLSDHDAVAISGELLPEGIGKALAVGIGGIFKEGNRLGMRRLFREPGASRRLHGIGWSDAEEVGGDPC